MKYIMLQHKELGNKVPIIFPKELVHAQMWESLLLNPMFGIHYKVVSAGECTITCTSVSGGSETLNLQIAEHDSEVIDTMDYMSGF